MATHLLIAFLIVTVVHCAVPDEDWGYVEVRDGAHMFWWLYGAEGHLNRTDTPLVMWLQGGPGGSSTGFGNFLEVGPLDVNLEKRAVNWVQQANVLFVDNPVGTGYSYVERDDLFTENEEEIAADLLALLKAFYGKYDDLRDVPFYIFSESYGGKMAASFAMALNKAIKSKDIEMNFGGVALGDSWIDPMSFVNTWGPYLLNMAEIDENGFEKIQSAANKTQKAVDQKSWSEATNLWGNVEQVVEAVSAGISFYNILDRTENIDELNHMKINLFQNHHLENLHEAALYKLMNGPIKKKLGIPSQIVWGGQANDVFSKLSVDFMQSVVDTVDYLLSENVKVIVYSGNLDLICCTIGTRLWMEQLKWEHYKDFKDQRYEPLYNSDKTVVAFNKVHKNLNWFTILSAGHMVPTDQPETAFMMLTKTIY